jgi:two-component system phosphate regulon response regulator PhoB
VHLLRDLGLRVRAVLRRAALWQTPGAVDGRFVDTHVRRLREKLGPARALIQTVRGLGDRLVDPADAGAA